MGWFGIGKEIAEPVKEIGTALDNLFTSDEERAQAEFVIEKLRQKPRLMQAMINQEHAKRGGFFHNGWRSMAGWICVAGLGYAAVVGPLLEQIFFIPQPKLHIGLLLDLLLALLGLGAIRSFDKIKGQAKG